MTAQLHRDLVVVTEPGVYDMPAIDYHAHTDWLSSTGARKLLPPSCPALFRYEQDHGQASTKAFDTGSAAHDVLLGGGPELVVVPDEITAKDGGWSTKDAKAFVTEARARGAIPIKPELMDEVQAMVAAVRAHPIAGRLFQPGTGTAEASLFWIDERTGVKRRARLDWLPDRTERRTIIADLKTTLCAQRDEFAVSARKYGYHQQAPYYLEAAHALDLTSDDAKFVFVAIEKKPPYLVNVIELDVVAMRIGAFLNRQAIDTFAECTRTGVWPGYSRDVELASFPSWYERQYEEDIAS